MSESDWLDEIRVEFAEFTVSLDPKAKQAIRQHIEQNYVANEELSLKAGVEYHLLSKEQIEREKREVEIGTLEAVSMQLDRLHQKTEGGGFVHYGEMGEWLDDSIAELQKDEE